MRLEYSDRVGIEGDRPSPSGSLRVGQLDLEIDREKFLSDVKALVHEVDVAPEERQAFTPSKPRAEHQGVRRIESIIFDVREKTRTSSMLHVFTTDRLVPGTCTRSSDATLLWILCSRTA